MDSLSMIERAAELRELAKAGELQRRREQLDGPRSAVAPRFGVDVSTLFRWEKGLSLPTGTRLREYHVYVTGLIA